MGSDMEINEHGRRWRVVALIAILIVALGERSGGQVKPGQSREPGRVDARVIAITNTTIIDVISGRGATGATVVLNGDRIENIGRDIPIQSDALRVDGTGKFLMPGLWDMHSHNEAAGIESLDLYLANGIVGTRDMGSDVDF